MICLVYVTCKLIHLGSKVKSRTNRYDLPRKIRTLELLCKTDLQWWNLLTSDLGCPSPQCGKPLKLFYPFLLHLWLPDKQSFQQFSSGGKSNFSCEAAGPWQCKNLWWLVRESSYVRKALSVGLCYFKQWCYDCPTRSLEPAALARSPHKNLSFLSATFNTVLCSHFLSCWLTFTWLLCTYLPKFGAFQHVFVLGKLMVCSHSTRWLLAHLISMSPDHFQSEICLEACINLSPPR